MQRRHDYTRGYTHLNNDSILTQVGTTTRITLQLCPGNNDRVVEHFKNLYKVSIVGKHGRVTSVQNN